VGEVFSNFRYRARTLGVEFAIPREYFSKSIFQPCYYCGKIGSNTQAGVAYNGLDRLEPEKGYVESNLVTCCSDCNYAKLDKTCNEFIEWVHNTSTYLRKKCLS
jgi:hypothetical protein